MKEVKGMKRIPYGLPVVTKSRRDCILVKKVIKSKLCAVGTPKGMKE